MNKYLTLRDRLERANYNFNRRFVCSWLGHRKVEKMYGTICVRCCRYWSHTHRPGVYSLTKRKN